MFHVHKYNHVSATVIIILRIWKGYKKRVYRKIIILKLPYLQSLIFS